MGNYEKEMAARQQVMGDIEEAPEGEDTRGTIERAIAKLAEALLGAGAAKAAAKSMTGREAQLDALESEALGE